MSVMVDDDLWSAVGDPTRRRMLDQLLSDGVGTATSLSEHLPVTRQAVTKHLVVLDRVGLVHATAAGRERQFRVDEDQLARAVAQLADVGAAWDSRLRRIKRIAESIQKAATSNHEGREMTMVDILHRIGVENSSPEAVYDALATIEGLVGLVGQRHVGHVRGRRRDPVPVRARWLRHGRARAGARQGGALGGRGRA